MRYFMYWRNNKSVCLGSCHSNLGYFYQHSACLLSCFSRVGLFATLWAVARQAPLSTGIFRQEYWSGLPCPPARDLPNPGIKPRSFTLQANSLPSEPPGKLGAMLYRDQIPGAGVSSSCASKSLVNIHILLQQVLGQSSHWLIWIF